MEHLSVYRGSVRETWTEGFHTGDSERRVIHTAEEALSLFN